MKVRMVAAREDLSDSYFLKHMDRLHTHHFIAKRTDKKGSDCCIGQVLSDSCCYIAGLRMAANIRIEHKTASICRFQTESQRHRRRPNVLRVEFDSE